MVLLLPGALGTIRSDMSALLDGLNSKGHLTLVAWDPPGYGASRPPERTWEAPLLNSSPARTSDGNHETDLRQRPMMTACNWCGDRYFTWYHGSLLQLQT